jgi:hypothetical protein
LVDLSYGLGDILEVLDRYSHKEDPNPSTEDIRTIFPVLKMLLNPITEFLTDECIMRKQREESKGMKPGFKGGGV